MKITSSQKNLYLLALALLAVAVALVCVWTFRGETQNDVVGAIPTPSSSPELTPEATIGVAANASAQDDAQTVSTVVYYQDNYGYLVPVMCNMAYQDGIAKATLGMMVKSPENDMNAARLGLRTVIPEDTTFDLDIADGLARIDLSKEVLNMEDAAAENNMVTAIIQTLTEFDSVQKVEFLVGGRKIAQLTHGTDVSGTFERGEVNPESGVETSGSALESVQLYFPCDSANIVVPVTRTVYSKADVNTAVLELAKGPGSQSPLERTLPAGCGLIDVNVENGIAKVNFTREFANLVENTDGGRLALKALALTCTQFDGIDKVEIFVEGEAYDLGTKSLDAPAFANVAEDIVYETIQTQSNLIFDFE